MTEFLEQFKQKLLSERKKPNTVVMYITSIRQFFTQYNLTSPSEITTDLVEKYIATYLQECGQGKVNTFVASIKKVVEFYNLKDISIPKTKKAETVNERIPLKEEELKKLIDGIAEPGFCRNPSKIRAMIAFLYYTGLRAGEVEKLKRVQVQGKDELIINQGKTNRLRPVIINKFLKDLLDHHFNYKDEKFNLFDMKVRGMHKWVNKAFKEILGKKGFPHLLRHSFVSHCHRKGVDIKAIQVAVGHATIQQTENYLKADARLMADEIREKVKGIEVPVNV